MLYLKKKEKFKPDLFREGFYLPDLAACSTEEVPDWDSSVCCRYVLMDLKHQGAQTPKGTKPWQRTMVLTKSRQYKFPYSVF